MTDQAEYAAAYGLVQKRKITQPVPLTLFSLPFALSFKQEPINFMHRPDQKIPVTPPQESLDWFIFPRNRVNLQAQLSIKAPLLRSDPYRCGILRKSIQRAFERHIRERAALLFHVQA